MAATIALLRLLETTTLRSFGLALLTVGGIAALLWIGQPVLIAMGFGSLIVFFVVIVAACVGIGVPIAFAFGIATMSYLGLTSAMPLSVVVNRMDEGMSNLLLLSVPMFVFLGLLMEMTGIARVMVAFLAALVGHVRGGLSYVLLGAMYLVSGISGLEGCRHGGGGAGAVPRDAPARLASRRTGGTAGEFQRDVGDHSAKPGADHHRLGDQRVDHRTVHRRPAARGGGGDRAGGGELVSLAPHGHRRRRARTGVGQIVRTFVIAVPGLTLPFVIRAAVIDGVATATEVSTVGVVYTARARAVGVPAVRLAADLSDAGRYACRSPAR